MDAIKSILAVVALCGIGYGVATVIYPRQEVLPPGFAFDREACSLRVPGPLYADIEDAIFMSNTRASINTLPDILVARTKAVATIRGINVPMVLFVLEHEQQASHGSCHLA